MVQVHKAKKLKNYEANGKCISSILNGTLLTASAVTFWSG